MLMNNDNILVENIHLKYGKINLSVYDHKLNQSFYMRVYARMNKR